VPGFVAAILIVGFLRVTLTLSGVPDRFTTFFSISVVIAVSMIYFGVTCRQWRDRVLAAYVLFVPYTLIAVPALGYTWVTVNALALTTCAKVMVVLGKCSEASCSHEAGALRPLPRSWASAINETPAASEARQTENRVLIIISVFSLARLPHWQSFAR